MTIYTNNDGLKESFGIPGTSEGGAIHTSGAVKELKILVDVVNGTPEAAAKGGDASFVLANSHIVSSVLKVTEAFVGGTSLTLGYGNKAGTAIDADGIDAAIATSALNAVGKSVVCDGALAEGVTVGAADAYPTSATAGTYTAGKAELYISYIS